MRATIGSIFAILSVLASPALAQQGPADTETKAVDAGMAAFRAGDYLAAEILLRPFAFDADGKVGTGYAAQMWSQTHAALSDWLPPPRRPASGLDADEQAKLDHATFAGALDEIVRRARDTRVVILNEDHSDSRCRAFAAEVARALRPLGYDLLAAETLTSDADEVRAANHMQLIAQRGELLQNDGFYTRDPVFADFFRSALKIGFRPVAYEATRYSQKASRDAQVASRERQEADNLIARALRGRPNAKMLVYVGFSHAAETPIPSGDGHPDRWMAARLKALTGIDPLTIDQTTIRLPDPPATDAYAATLASRIGTRSVVAIKADGTPLVLGQYAGAIDLQVIHPMAHAVKGRPDWLWAMGRTAVPVPANAMPQAGERLVQLFAAADPAKDAVPVDQEIVTAGDTPPPLLAPAGLTTRIAWQDPPAAP